jgi:hypothetical protein
MNELNQSASRVKSNAPALRIKDRVKHVWAYGNRTVFILLAALSLVGLANAQQRQGDGQRRPPEEAFNACKSLAAGTACKFSGERGEMTGSCWAPEGKPLACKPSGAGSQEKSSSRPPK